MKKSFQRIAAILLLCVLFFPGNAYAAGAVELETRSTTSYLEHITDSGGWTDLLTPDHYIVGTFDIAYCLQHQMGSPHIGDGYVETTLAAYYSGRVLNGLNIILERGYPAATPPGLTPEQARCATANAIRFWLSENGDPSQYAWTNRSAYPGAIRAKSGYQHVLAFADELLGYARGQQTMQRRVVFSPATLNLMPSGNYFIGTTSVTLVNCNGGYTLDEYALPPGSVVSGFTGRSGDVLTIGIPSQYGNQSIRLRAVGRDSRTTANIVMYASLSPDRQNLVAITTGGQQATGEGYLTLNTPANGDLRIVKTTKNNGGGVSGFQFRVEKQGGGTIGTYTTGSDGRITVPSLLAGWYTVEEINLSDQFVEPSPNPVLVEVRSGQTATVSFENVKKMGVITVRKNNSNPAMGDYSLAGAEFAVRDSGGAVVGTILTDANGRGESAPLPLGTYTVQEMKAPWGFVVDESVYSRTLSGSQGAGAIVYCSEIIVPQKPQTGRITVKKADVETGDVAQGDATLSGAAFDLFDSHGTLVERLYCGDNASAASKELSLGDGYVIEEVTPPSGYLLSSDEYMVDLTYAGQEEEVSLASVEVKNQVIRGRIQLAKHSDAPDLELSEENSQVQTSLAGVVFEVYLQSAGSYEAAKETERDRVATDEYGNCQTKDLPYGIYMVEEVEGPDEHKLGEPFEVFINEEGRTYFYVVENTAYTGKVKIVKVDEETGLPILRANTEFKVKNVDTGEWVAMEILYPTPVTIDSYLTNDEGWLVMPKPLLYGNYELHEVRSPQGYLLSETPVSFQVTSENPQELLEVTMPNKPVMGRLTLEKTGDVLVGAEQTGRVGAEQTEAGFAPRYEARPLPGVVFDIVARRDIVTPDGTLRAEAGAVVVTLTTDADGRAESKLLYLGDYYAVERETAPGMVLDATERDFSLVYEDQVTAVVSAQVSAHNERQRTAVSLMKYCEMPEDAPEGFDPYAGIRFGLFARKDIPAVDGSIAIPAGSLLETISLDAEGKAVIQRDLPLGKYYVKELQTGAGYAFDETEYDFEFAYSGPEVAVVEIAVNGGEAIQNSLQRGGLRIVKTFEGKEEPIAGVPFTISGQTAVGTSVTIQAVTDEKGEILLADLLVGEYTVQEMESELTIGYALAPESVVTIKHGTVVELSIHNELARGGLRVMKTFEGREEAVAGVKFLITGKTQDGTAYFEEFETDEQGSIFVEDLPLGEYTVKEIGSEQTEGYVLSEEQTITVGPGIAAELVIHNELIRGNVKVVKADKTSGNKLAGAVFDLFAPSGDPLGIYTTDENGEFVIEDLPYGEGYRLVETQAPDGYALGRVEITFDILEDGKTLEYTVTNERVPTPEPPDPDPGPDPDPNPGPDEPPEEPSPILEVLRFLFPIPKTGDDTNLMLWGVVLGLGVVGGGVIAVLSLRKKKKKEL